MLEKYLRTRRDAPTITKDHINGKIFKARVAQTATLIRSDLNMLSFIMYMCDEYRFLSSTIPICKRLALHSLLKLE